MKAVTWTIAIGIAFIAAGVLLKEPLIPVFGFIYFVVGLAIFNYKGKKKEFLD